MLDYFQSLIANCAVEWRAIPGYEGIYEASTSGQIRSVTRMQSAKDGRKPRLVRSSIKKPTQIKGKWNYYDVSFDTVAHGQKTYRVHALIAKTFIGERPSDNHVIDHINGNCCDNRVENLRYITASDNISKRNTYGNKFYGVQKSDDKWKVAIKKNGVRYYFGRYKTKEEALAVRLLAEKNMFGEFSPMGRA